MTASVWSIDFETRSRADIKLGLCRYFAPEAEPKCLWLAGQRSDGRWFLTDLTQKAPPKFFLDDVAAGCIVSGWNVMFEFLAWNSVLVKQHRVPRLELTQLRDTMAQAAACALPQSLAECAKALGTPLKDSAGHALINRWSKPAPSGGFREPEQDQERWIAFGDYCAQDVIAEKGIAERLPQLSPYEQRVWLQTQQINQRGIPVDINGIDRLEAIVRREKLRIEEEIKLVTGYRVTSVTETAKLLTWLREHGYPFDSIAADKVREALDG